jgi:hypothetical protein
MTTKTNTGLLPLVLGVASIIGSIAGTAWGGATWLNGKFAAEDAKITISERQRSQSAEGMQRQIDSLNATLKAMSMVQPKPTRELVHELLATKSMLQTSLGYDKTMRSNVIKK